MVVNGVVVVKDLVLAGNETKNLGLSFTFLLKVWVLPTSGFLGFGCFCQNTLVGLPDDPLQIDGVHWGLLRSNLNFSKCL